MLSRALSLATVTIVIGCLTAVAVRAVENLEAGKTPSQIFSGTCNACHKSPRGLLRTVPSSSLQGFLRQHYTTSSDMASVLASFLISNGAADQRFQKQDQAKQGKDGAKDAKQEAATRPAGQPDQADPNRNAKQRLPRPGETTDVMRPDQGPAQAAIDAKQGAKQKQGKKGRPGDEPPKAEEPAKTEQPSDAPKTETAKGDDSARPESKSETGKSETAKVDAPKEAVGVPPSTRPDPVPAVTPAPAATAAAPGASTVSVAPLDFGSSAPPAQAAQPAAPAVAAAPALPPVPPAGPPIPPISQ
jgi:hypothetical protein